MVTPKKIKCPWCSRIVGISKSGYLLPHLNYGEQRCGGGTGFKASQVEFINKANEPLDKK